MKNIAIVFAFSIIGIVAFLFLQSSPNQTVNSTQPMMSSSKPKPSPAITEINSYAEYEAWLTTYCKDHDCPSPQPTASTTPSTPHLVNCFVDKNGKFDIFYTECQAMADSDKEGFRKRALEICLDGRSPMFKEQGNREGREEVCNKTFSQNPYPISIDIN
jgi:hypothetical protein